MQTEKHEIVCLSRSGLNFAHTEGADIAAKVTYLSYTPGSIYDPREGVKQELIIPLLNTYW